MSTDDLLKKLFRQSAALASLKTALGKEGFSFLCHAIGGFTRILPHSKTERWKVASSSETTRVKWEDNNRRSIVVNIQLQLSSGSVCLSARLKRRTAVSGVGAIQRTLDSRGARRGWSSPVTGLEIKGANGSTKSSTRLSVMRMSEPCPAPF